MENDPLWYQDAVIYELHVRAFHDHSGDGMGDFRGMTEKLDYLQDLGVTTIWLLPFYPSPWRDDGYDIADYRDVHEAYGTLDDFKEFMQAAQERGLRVITELVINHTSDAHPWFQRARRSPPGSSERDFYVWSDTPEKYKDARIIFKDFESSNWTYDPIAKQYYWHRFYSHQPDLNYDNPAVWEAIFPLLDFWFEMGVDGLRLDAIPYLYEREGTNCENLPETHKFLKALRTHVEEHFENKMLLAEANQWPEDAVAYFGAGDESHMCFHFPVMPRMFMAIHMEDRFPIIDIMGQTPPIPEGCQWALFLRNHDELTLEMVTDEERDYMYRAYAIDPRARINLGIRRRLAPLLGNNRRRIELMNGLLFSLPGTPIIYYGDELGMGDNIYLGDRNGVRTPMQWSADRNAGFSRTNPQRLYLPVIIDPEYHFETVNVEAQQNNTSSLLWWMKRLIALRKNYKAFGRGTLEFLYPENRKILAFLRNFENETLLVIANMSRFGQHVELDLSRFAGLVPLELFGRTPFAPIGSNPYPLTLGPHSFWWFSLEKQQVGDFGTIMQGETELPVLTVSSNWEEIFTNSGRTKLEQLLPNYLRQRRWFGGKSRTIKEVKLRESVPIRFGKNTAHMTLITVDFTEGPAETYVLPLTLAPEEQCERLLSELPHMAVARVQGPGVGILHDALADPGFCTSVLAGVTASQHSSGERGGQLKSIAFPAFAKALAETEGPLPPTLIRAEQGNTSVVYGNRMILKMFRRVEEGMNPDQEVGRYLTEQRQFTHTAPVLGALEYRRTPESDPMTLALLQTFIPNEGDAWQYTLDELGRYFDRVLSRSEVDLDPEDSTASLLEKSEQEIPLLARELLQAYLESAALIGKRTAQLHVALAADTELAQFAPEPIGSHYQRSLYQSMRALRGQVLEQLKHRLKDLPDSVRPLAQDVLDRDEEILDRFKTVLEHKISGQRIRCHGDYHLGQVLHHNQDFVIIDFEGEPVRSISERRLKRSPLRDVTSMVRSFHYAANMVLFGEFTGRNQTGMVRTEDLDRVAPWAKYWYDWVSATFVRSYREEAGSRASFLPSAATEFRILFDAFLLEKALYELGYELSHRPTWVQIPIEGILQLLDDGKPSEE